MEIKLQQQKCPFSHPRKKKAKQARIITTHQDREKEEEMGCFRPKNSKTSSTTTTTYQEPINLLTQQILLQIPFCTVHLVEGGEAEEIARGEFKLVRILDDNVCVATIVRIGDDHDHDHQLQWPLTKDEPVVKLDGLHYLFSLPMKDGDPLSYVVTFLDQKGNNKNRSSSSSSNNLGLLDSFLAENSCFSLQKWASSSSGRNGNNVDWQEFAPRVEDYNNFLAKAIAGGTGQIVKGIFQCSNSYTNQVQKGGEMTLSRSGEEKNGAMRTEISSKRGASGATNKTKVNKAMKRARKLSRMTENLSKAMLNGVGIATGSVMGPMVKSQAGKSFLAMVPGQVLLASLDAVNKVMDAAEAAEKQAFSATTKATTRMVSNRYGESAGETAEDAFATAGHCFGTAWNIFKIRKAINPASVTTGVLKNAANIRNRRSY